MYIAQNTLHNVHCTMLIEQYILQNVHYTLHILHSTKWLKCMIYSSHCTLHSAYILHISQCILHISQCTLQSAYIMHMHIAQYAHANGPMFPVWVSFVPHNILETSGIHMSVTGFQTPLVDKGNQLGSHIVPGSIHWGPGIQTSHIVPGSIPWLNWENPAQNLIFFTV